MKILRKFKPRAKNRKGIFFTLAILLLAIPLLLLLSFYINLSQSRVSEGEEKMRCEELHYWIEDVKRDLQRAVVIFGRRAAIYSLGEVIEEGKGLENYTLNCTSACGINCDEFSYQEKGTEAALTELVLCGTFNGENSTYMVNHTLREWVEKILEEGEKMHYLSNITLTDIKIIPKDAWNFAIIMEMEIKAYDEGEMCFYQETPTEVMSITSIIGLEDPLYPLNTNSMVIKYINNCSLEVNLTQVIGDGSSGEGNGTGVVVLYSDLEGSTEERVCGVPDKEDKIMVFDQSFGLINKKSLEDCLSEFAGAVDYQDVGSDPNITSPYVYGTGDLNLSNSACIWLENNNIHKVLKGKTLEELSSDCYEVSDLEGIGENCSIKYPEGGSFFDRLDGNYFLQEKYINQSQEYFNVSKIGLEAITDIYELYYHAIPVNQNVTWIDYLYWQGVEGQEVEGICNPYGYKFRLDCQHLEKYLGATTSTTITTTTSTSTTSTTSTSTTTTLATTSTSTSTSTSTISSTTTSTTTSTTSSTSTTTSTTSSTTTSTSTTTTIPCSSYSVCGDCTNNGCIWNVKSGGWGGGGDQWCSSSCEPSATYCYYYTWQC